MVSPPYLFPPPEPAERAKGNSMTERKKLSPPEALKFIKGGDATVTLLNRDTGNRVTYRIRNESVWAFTGSDNASLAHYSLIGGLPGGKWEPRSPAVQLRELREKISRDPKPGTWVTGKPDFLRSVGMLIQSGRPLSRNQSYRWDQGLRDYGIEGLASKGVSEQHLKVFPWIWGRLVGGLPIPASVEIWHEGRCCRCNRKLTVPASIELGLGPDCAEDVGLGKVWADLNQAA